MFKNLLKNKIFFIFFLFSVVLFSKENYLLLTLDTVRCDHLSLYGYEKDTTPFLKSLKDKAVIFENAYSLVPLTFPSHITILTGKTPYETGIFLNGQKLEEEENYLPIFFKKNGYRTGGFVSSAILNAMFGLSKGFDVFSDVAPERGEVIKERSCIKTNEEVFKFLKEKKEPFFIWVHYFEPHSPYEPPQVYKTQFENPYDGELRAMDECVKELFQNIPKDTTVIIAGDHGEMLGEHNEDEHGVLLYEPAIKVPLMILKKGEKAKIKREFVSLNEIYPTFLSFFDKNEKSLLKKEKEEPIIPSSLYGRETFGFYPVQSTIFEANKLINYGNKEYLLFDLKSDPNEKNNLFSTENPKVRELKKIQDKNPLPDSLKIALKDEDKKVLTSLGYSLPKKTEKLIHPELGLLLQKELKKAEKLIQERRYSEAENLLLSVIQREPGYAEAKRLLGRLYLKTGQSDKAMGAFTSFSVGDEQRQAKELARKKYNEGNLQEAIRIMEEEVILNPNSTNYGELAFYYFEAGRYEKIQKLYDNAKNEGISSPLLLVYYGLYKIKENKLEEGMEEIENALSINPKLKEGIKAKGIAFYFSKKYEEALKLIENYLGMEPRDWEGYYFKGKILKELNKYNQARDAFEKAKEVCNSLDKINTIQKEIEAIK